MKNALTILKNRIIPTASKDSQAAERCLKAALQSGPAPVVDDFFLVDLIADRSHSTFLNSAFETISNAWLKAVEAVRKTDLRDTTEFAVTYYGVKTTTEVTPFVRASEFDVPDLPRANGTYIYEGLCTAVAHTLARKEELEQEHHRDCSGIFLIYLSDFQVTSPDHRMREEALKAKLCAEENGMNLFMFGAGNTVDETVAKELGQYVKLELVDFDLLFGSWLARSIRMRSASGRGINLPRINEIEFRAE